jgi:sugar-specific transcriptional regulator TrmB
LEEPTDANAYLAMVKIKSRKAFALAKNSEINLTQESFS